MRWIGDHGASLQVLHAASLGDAVDRCATIRPSLCAGDQPLWSESGGCRRARATLSGGPDGLRLDRQRQSHRAFRQPLRILDDHPNITARHELRHGRGQPLDAARLAPKGDGSDGLDTSHQVILPFGATSLSSRPGSSPILQQIDLDHSANKRRHALRARFAILYMDAKVGSPLRDNADQLTSGRIVH